MRIILYPTLTTLDYSTLDSLARDISKEFKNTTVTVDSPCTQLDAEIVFQSNFDRNRNQWYSPKLLDSIFQKLNPDTDTKGLIIFDVDAYSYGLNFVFGEAIGNGPIAIVYLPRIKQEFYGLKPSEQMFYERLVKESVHELGHAFGLTHCNNKRCVMHFSNSLQDTDFKKRSFCESCNCKWN